MAFKYIMLNTCTHYMYVNTRCNMIICQSYLVQATEIILQDFESQSR